MISFTGRGTPRFEHSGTSFDYTPSDSFEHLIRDELVDANITRPSIKNGTVKVIKKGQWVRNQYVFRESKDNIDKFIAIAFEDIVFTPDTSKGFKYSAVVEGVEIDDTDPLRVYVIVMVLSKKYCDPGTHITITSPNGSGTYQRNEIIPITWSSYSVSGYAGIELWKNDEKLSDIVTAASETVLVTAGTYNWTIPADAVIASDYQIKVLDSTGYIYDLSDANFSITYDGFNLYDGTDDFTLTKLKEISTTGDWTISWWYNANGVARPDNEYLFGQYQSVNYNFDIFIEYTGNKLRYVQDNNGKTIFSTSASSISTDAGWHHFCLRRQYVSGASVVTLYIDGVSDTMTTSTNTLDAPGMDMASDYLLVGKYDTGTPGYIDARSLKHIIIYNKVISTGDIAKLYAKDYYTMTDTPINNPTVCKMFWRCNEADPGSPYTDATIDYSGNNNHGTPTNIAGTFFNQS